MARIVSATTEVAPSPAHRGELATLDLLKTGLGPEFTVYHGVDWTRAHERRMEYGEIDFVVVNRDGRILLIEQKNGPLVESGAVIEKHYPGKRTNIRSQIRRNVDAIREKFKMQDRRKRTLEIDYLIYCPDHRLVNVTAAGLDRDRIVDASRRDRLVETIAGRLEVGTGADSELPERIHRFFRQEFQIVPDIHARIGAQDRSIARLNAALVDAIGSIEMSPLRLRVRGVAGCGKTSIAVYFYQRALKAGKRPLMVCFNRPLREKLKAIVPDCGLVQTWNGLCGSFLEDCGMAPDYRRMFEIPDFWTKVEEEVRDRVLEGPLPEAWKFDSLIVDEAQDFDPEWFQILKLFLNDDPDILWLEDPDQNIRRTAPPDEAGFVGWRARQNHRSPRAVARFVRSVLPFDFECAGAAAGFDVSVWPYDAPEDQPRIAAKRVTELVRRGFRKTDIVLLTMRGFDKSVMSGRGLRLGNFALSRFEGDYDRFSNQKVSEGDIRFDSIHRFKGQQSPAVILCDIDPEPERLEDWEKRLYCGMTRATVHLELLAARSNPWCERLIEAARS